MDRRQLRSEVVTGALFNRIDNITLSTTKVPRVRGPQPASFERSKTKTDLFKERA